MLSRFVSIGTGFLSTDIMSPGQSLLAYESKVKSINKKGREFGRLMCHAVMLVLAMIYSIGGKFCELGYCMTSISIDRLFFNVLLMYKY